jgi:hypothetical protein
MPVEITYHECRTWARWLDTFSDYEFADVLRVDPEVARKFIRAMVWHGIVEDTGDEYINGYGVPEHIYAYVPLPTGPTEHITKMPPEKATPGCYGWAPRRGMPVRLVDTGRQGSIMQVGGGGRRRYKDRERAYQRMVEAVEARKTKQKQKRIEKLSKGKKAWE